MRNKTVTKNFENYDNRNSDDEEYRLNLGITYEFSKLNDVPLISIWIDTFDWSTAESSITQETAKKIIETLQEFVDTGKLT